MSSLEIFFANFWISSGKKIEAMIKLCSNKDSPNAPSTFSEHLKWPKPS